MEFFRKFIRFGTATLPLCVDVDLGPIKIDCDNNKKEHFFEKDLPISARSRDGSAFRVDLSKRHNFIRKMVLSVQG